MEQPFFPVTKREAERVGIKYSSKANKNALFPSQLRKLRTEKSVSQEALSKILGVSKSTIGLWENGDTLPDAKAIRDLAQYFEVTSDYLLGLSKAQKKEYHDFAEQTHFHQETISQLMKLSGDGREELCFKRYRIAFEYLLHSPNFDEIIPTLCEYLDSTSPHEKVKNFSKMYIDLDRAVSDVSKGNFRAVSSALLAQTMLSKAQRMICDAFKDVLNYVYSDGGWEEYMPK